MDIFFRHYILNVDYEYDVMLGSLRMLHSMKIPYQIHVLTFYGFITKCGVLEM